MAALNEMPRAVAEHEVAHLLGACIAFIGDANPRMTHFCEHPRFHDAYVYLGFDAAAGQGEFAIVVNKFVPHQPEMPDETLAMIRRSSAIAPIGLVRDQNRILRCVREAKHWLDVLDDFSGVLSSEDRVIAIKGAPTFTKPEELVGLFAFDAAKKVAPERVEGIIKLVMKHNGIGETMLLHEFIPRQHARDILQEALRTARTCFAIAHA